MECRGPLYVLCTMWMGYPDQTGRLQGHLRVGAAASAENEWGNTRPVGLMDKASASGAGDSKFESWAGHVITRESDQAGNKASRTEHYLQWWENSPEWNTETSAADKRHNSSLHYVKARSDTRILVCFACWLVRLRGLDPDPCREFVACVHTAPP